MIASLLAVFHRSRHSRPSHTGGRRRRWRRNRTPAFTVRCGGCPRRQTFDDNALAQDSLTIHLQLVHGVRIDPYRPPHPGYAGRRRHG